MALKRKQKEILGKRLGQIGLLCLRVAEADRMTHRDMKAQAADHAHGQVRFYGACCRKLCHVISKLFALCSQSNCQFFFCFTLSETLALPFRKLPHYAHGSRAFNSHA